MVQLPKYPIVFSLCKKCYEQKYTCKTALTSTVVSPVLQPLEAGDEEVQDLLPGLRGEIVEVGKDPAHVGGLVGSLLRAIEGSPVSVGRATVARAVK